MWLDKLGPHYKRAGTDEDLGDTELGVELENVGILRAILKELRTSNQYFALFVNEDNPPDRETNDSD